MSINSINIAPHLPHPPCKQVDNSSILLDEKEKYLGIIKAHISQDNRNYSKKDLRLFTFSLNATLPSIFSILTSPYYIATNVAKLIKNKLNNQKKDLTETNLKISTHLINFIHSCITPLLYFSYFGISVLEASIFIPFVFATAALSALLNISSSTYSIFSIKKFMRSHKIGTFISISEIYSEEDPKKITRKLSRIINQAKQDIKISSSLEDAKREFHSDPKNQDKKMELLEQIKLLEQQLILNFFDKLEQKYLVISEDFKNKTETEFETKSLQVGKTKALEICIKKIEKEHKLKKIILATELRPVVTEKFLASYKNIIQMLKSNQQPLTDEGLTLGRKMVNEFDRALNLKKKIQITNIALSILGLAAATISSFAHLPIFAVGVLIGISFTIYYLNHFTIHGNLDRANQSFDWRNCFPSWLTKHLN